MNNSSTGSDSNSAIEKAMQWVLEDLFNNKEPSLKDWALIPQGNATEAFQALRDALPDGTTGVQKVFKSLSKTEAYKWLKPLRIKKIPHRPGPEGKEEEKTDNLIGTRLSEVTPKAVSWLWPSRLPLGKLVIVDGDPGLGKTTLLFDIAARLTKGRSMPCEDGKGMKGGVVLICLEDGLEDTIQPRLDRAGADLSKIVSIGYIKEITSDGDEYERPFSITQDMKRLEANIKDVGAKLVIIDPIMAILGGKDTYKDNEVRVALAPLKELAERCDVCIAMIRHVNKSGGDKLIYQGGGSIAFIGLARVGLMVLRNPNDEEQCILANPKNNLSKLAPKLLYRVVSEEGEDERPHIQWDGITTISDQELTSRPETQGESRQEILKCLKSHFPDSMTYQQIAEELNLDESVVKNTLSRMVSTKQVDKPARNTYLALSGLN